MRIPTSEEAQNNRIRNMFIINWKMEAKHGGIHQYGESRWCRQYRSAPNWHELILDTTVPPSSVACATGLSRTQTANVTFINKYLASFNKQKECQFQQVTRKIKPWVHSYQRKPLDTSSPWQRPVSFTYSSLYLFHTLSSLSKKQGLRTMHVPSTAPAVQACCDSWEACALCPSYRKCSVTHSWVLWNGMQKILITAKC